MQPSANNAPIVPPLTKKSLFTAECQRVLTALITVVIPNAELSPGREAVDVGNDRVRIFKGQLKLWHFIVRCYHRLCD